MRDINWIAILGICFLCPMIVSVQADVVSAPQKVVSAAHPKAYPTDHRPGVCFALIEDIRISTPSVTSVVCLVNRTESEWVESKPIFIRAKRFIRPKIIDFPA